MPAQIILLTGPSSSGKTSISKALQIRLNSPFLHMQLDTFIEMMPPTYNDDLFVSMVYGFHQSIGAMARTGHQIIVDHVLLLPEWVEDFAHACNKAPILYVGVMCGLNELERREQGRDARRQGFARSQYSRIHAGRTYDIEVHTDRYTSEECAEQILDFYNTRSPTVLSSYYAVGEQGRTIR